MPPLLPSSSPPNFPLVGLVNLATHAFGGGSLASVVEQLLVRLQKDERDAAALMDLSTIYYLSHQPDAALQHQHAAMQLQRRYSLTTSPQHADFHLLALLGDGGLMDNLPIEFLLTDSTISMDLHYVALGDPVPDGLQAYDAVMVAVGESDRNKPLLQQLSQQLKSCPIPLLNSPEQIMLTTREDAAKALQYSPHVVMPRSVRVSREVLQTLAEGQQHVAQHLPLADFPIIIRPVESHAGQGLARLDRPADIPIYLAEQPHESLFYISPYIDYSSHDGQFRKYRVVLMKGQPFLAHLAISSHWIVHYLNADMVGDAKKCTEEAECMAHFDEDFGKTYQQAFAEIYDALQLEYLILDCAETHHGQLLVFEVDTSAIVHNMDPIELFPYKHPQMNKIFRAFQQMLKESRAS